MGSETLPEIIVCKRSSPCNPQMQVKALGKLLTCLHNQTCFHGHETPTTVKWLEEVMSGRGDQL